MRRRSGQLPLIAFALLTVVPVVLASDSQQDLRDHYRGKTLLLRGFYAGDKLRYDSSGALLGGARPGAWTTDGVVQLNDVHLSGSRLTIKARRLVVSKSNQMLLADMPKSKKKLPSLKIEAHLGVSKPSADQLNAVMSKIFLAQRDDFAALVPDYWQPCVRAAMLGQDQSCRFAPEFLSIPGMQSSNQGGSSSIAESEAISLTGPVFHVGHGVKPPRQIFAPEPSFSELARQANYQGIVTLGLIVDEQGLPGNIRITAPLGYGLDEQSVQAVQSWKFTPAEKDGRPVRVEIEVVADFHLY